MRRAARPKLTRPVAAPKPAPDLGAPAAHPVRSGPAALWAATNLGAAALLVGMVVLAYLPALRAGFIWDDDDYITANLALRSVDGLRRIWLEPGAVPQYYPLTFTSFWLEHQLWGLEPLGYHAVNLLLHALNTVLLWRILRQLRVPGAWMAAAIFGLHPIQVESVAWITERKNVLSGMFALSATLVYLTRVAPGGRVPNDRIAWRWYLAACALYAGALWSKTITCSLPAVLLLIAWWKQGTIDRRTPWLLAPLFALGLGMASVTIWMERHHVGAQGQEWTLSLLERGLVAGRALWFYPATLLWPHRLTFIYPRWSIDASVWWQYLFPAAAVAVLITLYAARRRLGRGPLVAALCYAGTMVPALGFVDVYPMRFSFVADHFAYLPSVGLIVLVTAAGATIVARIGAGDRRVAYAVCAPVLLVLAVLTARQCGIYRNLLVLWTDTLAKHPACWMAHNNLGATLIKEGRREEAFEHFESALRLKPDFPEAHNNFGAALRAAGRLAEATAHWQEAVRLNPDFPDAHNNLGGALYERGRSQEAIEHFERALELQPDFPSAYNNLGTVRVSLGQLDAGIGDYEQALRLDPDYPEANYNLGRAFLQAGQLDRAAARFRHALQRKPDYPEAHNDLGIALVRQGRLDDAIEQFQQAVRIKPDYDDARSNLERALAMQQDN